MSSLVANGRGKIRISREDRCFADSSLEGTGFEPLVPRKTDEILPLLDRWAKLIPQLGP